MKYKTSGSENSLKNPVNGGSVPADAAGTGGMHQGSGPHVNSQDLSPTLQFPLVVATAGKRSLDGQGGALCGETGAAGQSCPAPHHPPGPPRQGQVLPARWHIWIL